MKINCIFRVYLFIIITIHAVYFQIVYIAKVMHIFFSNIYLIYTATISRLWIFSQELKISKILG